MYSTAMQKESCTRDGNDRHIRSFRQAGEPAKTLHALRRAAARIDRVHGTFEAIAFQELQRPPAHLVRILRCADDCDRLRIQRNPEMTQIYVKHMFTYFCDTILFMLPKWGLDMSNLTVSVDDEIIKRARVRAIQQGTSVSAKIREFLEHYVNESEEMLKKQRVDATALLMQAIEAATSQTQPGAAAAVRGEKQRRTLRDDLYQGDFRARDRIAAKAK